MTTINALIIILLILAAIVIIAIWRSIDDTIGGDYFDESGDW